MPLLLAVVADHVPVRVSLATLGRSASPLLGAVPGKVPRLLAEVALVLAAIHPLLPRNIMIEVDLVTN